MQNANQKIGIGGYSPGAGGYGVAVYFFHLLRAKCWRSEALKFDSFGPDDVTLWC